MREETIKNQKRNQRRKKVNRKEKKKRNEWKSKYRMKKNYDRRRKYVDKRRRKKLDSLDVLRINELKIKDDSANVARHVCAGISNWDIGGNSTGRKKNLFGYKT